jgi:lipooligosaccharide transport system permease protein
MNDLAGGGPGSGAHEAHGARGARGAHRTTVAAFVAEDSGPDQPSVNPTLVSRPVELPPLTTARAVARMLERNANIYRRSWLLLTSSLVEPALYLLSIGIGVGALVGDISGPGGEAVSYREFIAPALLVAAAMNGAIAETTFNFFNRLRTNGSYDAMLATPLRPSDVAWGETVSATARGSLASLCFLIMMLLFGLVGSWWGLLALPAAVLVGFAFAAAGIAATSFTRSFVQLDYVFLAVMPLFLLSATFFPLERYPGPVQALVQVTPLYQGVALSRSLIFGDVHAGLLVHVAYLAVMGWVCVRVSSRRLHRLLCP